MLTTPALPPPEPAPHSRSAPSQSPRVPLLAAPDTPFPPPRLPLLLAREAPNGVVVRSTPLPRGTSTAVVGDFVPAARSSPESARKLVAGSTRRCSSTLPARCATVTGRSRRGTTAQNASAADTNATAQNASAADTNATAQNASAADTNATAQNASAAEATARAANARASDVTGSTAQNASAAEATARAANARASDVTGSTAGDAEAAGSSSSKSQALPIILGSTLGSLALGVACVCCFCSLRKSTSVHHWNAGVEARPLLLYV